MPNWDFMQIWLVMAVLPRVLAILVLLIMLEKSRELARRYD